MTLESKWGEGIRLYHEGLYTDSARNFEDAGSTAKLKFNIGMCHAQNRDYAAAMSWFEDALKLDPYLAISHAWLALVFYHLGRYDKAVHYFTKAIDLYNINETINYRPLGLDVTISKSELYFDRALCHYRDKELTKAKSDLLLAKPGGSESLKQVINILLESLDYIESSEEDRMNAAIYEKRGRVDRSGSMDESPRTSKDGKMFESRKRSLPVSRNSLFTVLSDFVYEDEVIDDTNNDDDQEPRAQEDMELMEFLTGGSDAVEFDKELLTDEDGQEGRDDTDIVILEPDG